MGKQEFHRTDFGSRLLVADVRGRGVSEVKQYPSGSGESHYGEISAIRKCIRAW